MRRRADPAGESATVVQQLIRHHARQPACRRELGPRYAGHDFVVAQDDGHPSEPDATRALSECASPG